MCKKVIAFCYKFASKVGKRVEEIVGYEGDLPAQDGARGEREE